MILHIRSSSRGLKLQWGHDFSAVEMDIFAGNIQRDYSGLQWGHDFSAVEIAAIFRPL